MTRTVAREIAIQLSFAAQLAGDDARETADTFFSREYFATLAEEDPLFLEYPDEKQLDYIRRLTGLVYDHMYELNHMIEKYARGWRLERISRVAAAIMRCAMCEILYMDDAGLTVTVIVPPLGEVVGYALASPLSVSMTWPTP